MRSLIQYDLDDPPPGPSTSQSAAPHLNTHRPPAKKRKRNHAGSASYKPKVPVPVQHWDDPGSSSIGVVYDEEGSASVYEEDRGEDAEHEEGEGEEEESRPLTHEEIWDDSALIDAWNSAEAEYQAYHGTKDWKAEPLKKSPLWYNKPYSAPPHKPGPGKRKQHPHAGDDDEPEPDTAPLDFNTYVPTHDPSLASPGPPPTAPFFVPPPSTMTVSRDEAFNNALSAMYWSGYWTAVYHCRSQNQAGGPEGTTEESNGADHGGEGDEEIQDLVPAQR